MLWKPHLDFIWANNLYEGLIKFKMVAHRKVVGKSVSSHVINEHVFQPKQKKVFQKNRVQFPED